MWVHNKKGYFIPTVTPRSPWLTCPKDQVSGIFDILAIEITSVFLGEDDSLFVRCLSRDLGSVNFHEVVWV